MADSTNPQSDHPQARRALATGEAVLVYTKGTTDTITYAREAGHALSLAKPGRGASLAFLATAATAKKVFGVAKPFIAERDLGAINRAETVTSVALSCGALGVAMVTVGLTGGLTAFVTVTQAIVCGKNLIDLFTLDGDGHGWFDQSATHKWTGLALETVGLIGSLFGLGSKYASRPMIGLIARGLAGATRAEKVAATAEFAALSLKGVGVILEPRQNAEMRETQPLPGQVEQILDQSGLPWRNTFFERDCFDLKISPRFFLGGLDVRSRIKF